MIDKQTTHVVVECGGVGYFAHISLNTFEQLPAEESVFLLTHQVIREDAHVLFGFMTERERSVFLLLLSVSGVGASTARLILSAMQVDELIAAIGRGDDKLLTKIKGLGPKTAARLVLELKDKVDKLGGAEIISSPGNKVKSEALSGLQVLGFDKKKAEMAIDKVWSANPSISVEELIKSAIKTLY